MLADIIIALVLMILSIGVTVYEFSKGINGLKALGSCIIRCCLAVLIYGQNKDYLPYAVAVSLLDPSFIISLVKDMAEQWKKRGKENAK